MDGSRERFIKTETPFCGCRRLLGILICFDSIFHGVAYVFTSHLVTTRVLMTYRPSRKLIPIEIQKSHWSMNLQIGLSVLPSDKTREWRIRNNSNLNIPAVLWDKKYPEHSHPRHSPNAVVPSSQVNYPKFSAANPITHISINVSDESISMESQNLSDKATQIEPSKKIPWNSTSMSMKKTKDAFLTMVMIDLYDILTLYVRGRKITPAIDIRTSIISLPIHYLPVS